MASATACVMRSMGEIFLGKEELIERDGHRYHGAFKDCLLEGLGWHQFPDKTLLEGFFVKGILHGKGCITHPDKSVWEGEFNEGKLVSGTMIHSSGSKRIGQFANGVLEGFGKHIKICGQVDEGWFENGRLTYRKVKD